MFLRTPFISILNFLNLSIPLEGVPLGRVYSHFFEDEFKNVPNVMEEFLTVKAN